MHPIFGNKKALLLYILSWLVIGSMVDIPFIRSMNLPWFPVVIIDFPILLLYALVSLSTYYLCRMFPLQGTRWRFAIPFFVILSLLFAAALLALSYQWVLFVDSLQLTGSILWAYEQFRQPPWIAGMYITLVMIFLLIVAINYVIIALQDSRNSERQSFDLKIMAQDAELRAMRAQINPHFLFNSLNSISALTTQNPERAREMTLLLADFFRTVSKVSMQPTIPLEQEIALIRTYLEIEQVRFGSRLKFSINTDVKCEGCTIPTLLLQPLVENAVKHGIAQVLDGGTIDITLTHSPSYLRIRLTNPIDPDSAQAKGNRTGLENVRKRLTTSYGLDATLDVFQKENTFIVEIALPHGQKA